MNFAAWWALYPRHIAKQSALKAYTRLTRTVSPAAILMGLQDHIQWEWKGRPLKFIPYPASWLRATDFSRWEERTETLFDEEDEFLVAVRQEKEKAFAEALAELEILQSRRKT